MPFNKNPIKDKELSIQIFKDGFSFCTSNARPFFKFEKISIDQGKSFQAILKSNSFLDSKKSKRFTLIIRQLLYLNHYITLPKRELTSTIIYLLRRAGALLKKKHKTMRSKSCTPLTRGEKPPYSFILKTLASPITPKFFTILVSRKQMRVIQ